MIVPIPAKLVAELETHRLRLLEVVHQMGRALQKPRTRVKLDFSKVERMFPGGTLMLLALVQLYVELYPGRIKASCPPGSLPAQLLRHFGFGEALGIPLQGNSPRHPDVINWEYLTDEWADGAKVSALLDKYRGLINAELPDDLYAVLTEGITNVRHWAYPQDCDIPHSMRRWWMFSRYVEPPKGGLGNLFIAIYDIGVGIPETLSAKLKLTEKVVEVVEKVTGSHHLDKTLLAQAVDDKRSGTGQPNRGKGLPEMKEFIQNTEGGRLYIVSGHAQYSCIPAEKYSGAQKCSIAFPGTLILWSLPLKEKDEHHD